jgi:predicted DNA-binding antitoxin AbrB/MazE fold protein
VILTWGCLRACGNPVYGVVSMKADKPKTKIDLGEGEERSVVVVGPLKIVYKSSAHLVDLDKVSENVRQPGKISCNKRTWWKEPFLA